MLKKLKITKLFGRFDYNIELKNGGITILTGPNGYGKSTILRIIEAISKGDLDFFIKLNFSKILLIFPESEICMLKDDKQFSINGHKVDLKTYKNKHMKYILYEDGDYIEQAKYLRNAYSFNEIKSIDEANNYVFENVAISQSRNSDLKNANQNEQINLRTLLKSMQKLCGRVRFISEQRLIQEIKSPNNRPNSYNEKKMRHVITDIPNDLRKEITRISEEYSQVSNRLDSTYPQRLFSTKKGLKNSKEFDKKISDAYVKFNKLKKYSLIINDMIPLNSIVYKDKFAIAFKIYFDDFEKKYHVFEPLIIKLDLFTEIINARLLFKEIRITQKGFIVIDTENQNILDLNQLSSGEKQEIVLFYDLIFRTNHELLLLIDEPEISLHIAWQKMFLDDLLKVSKNVNLKAIIATHSPQIISNHWDIQIDLGELYECKFN